MKQWKMIVMTAIIAALVVALVLVVIETQKTKNPIDLAMKRVIELRVIEEEARLTYSILKSRQDTAELQKSLPKTD